MSAVCAQFMVLFKRLQKYLTLEPPEFHKYLEPPMGQKCPM